MHLYAHVKTMKASVFPYLLTYSLTSMYIDPTVKEMIGILDNLLLYLRTLYQARGDFRDMCVKPEVVDAMIAVIYPAIASTDQVLNAADELALGEGIFTLVMSADGLSMDDQSQTRGDEASSIIRRGGTSTLMTKTSPHTSRKLGAMITKLRYCQYD